MTRPLLLLLSLAACTGSADKPADPDDTAGTDTDSGHPDDTDTADTDSGDTAADCAVDLPAAGAVDADPACAPGAADVDPFELVLERRITSQVPRHAPVVAHVDDDDGDGTIGVGDHAEFVGVDRFGGSFGSSVAVFGEGNRPIWEHRDGWYAEFDPIFADLDGDGAAELVLATDTAGWDTVLVALDGATGAEKWRTESIDMDCLRADCQSTAADVDGDGVAEVIVEGAIVDGATGEVEALLTPPGLTMFYRGPLVADLDGDGAREIVIGDTAYDADGVELWTLGGEVRSAFPALAQLDDDPEAEIVVTLDYDVLFLDHDGTERFRGAIPGAARFGWAGPACVGDLDGDGASEVVVPGGEAIEAYEADGSRAWSAPMYGTDGTGWYAGTTGCTLFDFDRDGDVEVLFGDAMSLRILDGRTGDTLAETTDYGAYMTNQVPVVADIDADGSAEILAASTGHILNTDNWSGLQVYGHPRDAWRTEGTVWGVHDFAVANQTVAGGFPATATPSWIEPGLFRGQVAVPATDVARPALVIEVADRCEACDADAAHLAVVVGNAGAADAADVVVELRAVAADGSARVLASEALGGLVAGTSHAGVDLAWAPSEVADGERLEVVGSLAGEACAIGGALEVDRACE